MKMKYILQILTVLFIFFVSCGGVLKEYPGIKVCQMKDVGKHLVPDDQIVKRLRNQVENCTHVSGSLYLHNIQRQPNGSDPDLSFLESIREISGMLSIQKTSVTRIPLINLRVIRGQEGESYSLHVSNNHVIEKSKKSMKEALEELDLRNLRAIMNNSVYFSNNPGLCYMPDKINWNDLFENDKQQKLIAKDDEFKEKTWCIHSASDITVSPHADSIKAICSQSCPEMNGTKLCWGPSVDQCQKITKCRDRPCKRCYTRTMDGASQEECCSERCVGGCNGTGDDNCLACKYFLNGQRCVEDCPKRYIPHKTQVIPNPDYKVNLGPFCVKKCPVDFFLKEGDVCVKQCNLENHYPEGNECKPCKGACPKACKLDDIMPHHQDLFLSVTADTIPKFANCTYLMGSLVIGPESFAGRVRPGRKPITDPADFNYLRSLREVTGHVYIDLSEFPNNTTMTNLSFLENLEVIRAEPSKQGMWNAFSVLHSSTLEFLGTRSLRKVGQPINIVLNTRLCYVDRVPWSQISPNGNHVTLNRAPKECVENGKVCDKACNQTMGCWGPGSRLCVKCAKLKAGDQCVFSCSDVDQFYNNGVHRNASGNCAACHKECLRTCTGPKASQCLGGCKNAMRQGSCVSGCPYTMFKNETNKRCTKCHADCHQRDITRKSVCTGPLPTPGPNGCNKCFRVFVDARGHVGNCTNKPCPEGMFVQYESNNPRFTFITEETSGDVIPTCRPCHPYCSKCKYFSTLFGDCLRCRHFWHKGVCVKKCPADETYLAAMWMTNGSNSQLSSHDLKSANDSVCLACHEECRKGCKGPGPENCFNCKHFKIYLDKKKTVFNCTAACPPDRNYDELEAETSDRMCLFEYESIILKQARHRTVIIASIICALVVIVLIGLVIMVWCLRKKAETERIREQLKAAYSNIKEPDSKNQTLFSRQPNLGRLEMINADDLLFENESRPLGVGAFGAVYKGQWLVPKTEKHSARRYRLEVAIKVITDSGAGARANVEELLEEARLMASVSHKHCLRLIGVCLSQERCCLVSAYVANGSMDRYLRQHSSNLSSLVLLSWAEQIADGMAYLEIRGIIHRDLATRNVLVNTRELVQITDFGLAKTLEDDGETEVIVKSGRVPIRWLAIETLTRGIYSPKTDVWAYGVTLWEIFTFGRRPYENVDTIDIKDHVMKGGRLSQPDICTLDVYMVMVKCWMEDPDSRPTFLEIMKTFNTFCHTPGRYLSIPGDQFELRNNRADNFELHPMLNSASSMNANSNFGEGTLEYYLQPSTTSFTSGPALSNEPLLRVRSVTPQFWRRGEPSASLPRYQGRPDPPNDLSHNNNRLNLQHESQPRHNLQSHNPRERNGPDDVAFQRMPSADGCWRQDNMLLTPEGSSDEGRYCSDPTEGPSQLSRLTGPSLPAQLSASDMNSQYVPPASIRLAAPGVVLSKPNGNQKTRGLSNDILQFNKDLSGENLKYAQLSDKIDDDYVPPSPSHSEELKAISNPEYFIDQYSQFYPEHNDYLQPTTWREKQLETVKKN